MSEDRGAAVERFMKAGSFNEMGDILHIDFKQGYEIRAGQIFEGATVKGGRNLIVALRAMNGFIFYAHGDRVKKVRAEEFVRAVESGDLEPKDIRQVDAGRLSMAAIGLDAIANRRTGEEMIQYHGEGAEERFAKGGLSID